MLLKQLEIHGFKSFADKTELHFNPGITVVVGPNGSGKSNITEAVRWVLGEQSAKSLRGSKMEDIIFAGSNKRKALGMAEVSLTLDNSTGYFPLDYSEITVTRRVYRSGESEFLINKVPCRLRDIQELFQDTGIGKDGYSLVGQGKIDEILSSKPEERRSLIEEAAGIVKYRNRKAQAVKKLTETEVNLLRINDIITELEGQREPLAEQAEKARQYLELKEELTSLEINFSVHQLEEIKEKLVQVREQAAHLSELVLREETAYVTEESHIEEERLNLSRLDETMSGEQQAFYNLVSSLEKTESEVRIAEERLRGLADQEAKTREEIAGQDKLIANLSRQYADEEEKWQAVRAKLSETEKELENAETEASLGAEEIARVEMALEEAKGDVIDLLNLLANKRNESKYLASEGENIENRRAQSGQRRAALEQEIAALEQNRRDRQNDYNAHVVGLKEEEQKARELAKKIVEGDTRLQQERREKNALLAARQQKVSRSQALTEMQDDYEGYHRGVKEVMQAAKGGASSSGKASLAGIHGVVAEIFKVPDCLEKAMESVLGQSLQFVVTEDEDAAKKAISYLKSHKAGRATFLPLTTVQGQSLNAKEKEAAQGEGVLGCALDLVGYDKKYEKVLSSLLGRIVVTENMNTALKVAKKAGFKFRIVTLDGDLMHPGGSMTGGSSLPQKTAFLGRLREIETLNEAVAELDKKIKSLAKEEETLNLALQQAEKERLASKERQDETKLALVGLEKDLHSLEENLRRLKDDHYLLELEERQLGAEKEDMAARKENVHTELAMLEEQNNLLQKKIEEFNIEAERLKGDIKNKESRVTAAKVKMASLQQEEVGLGQALSHFHKTRDEYRESVERKNDDLQNLALEREELQYALEKNREDLALLFHEKEERGEKLANLRGERQSLSDSIAEREKQLRQKQKQLQENQRELHLVELKETRLDSEWENALARLMDEYGLSFEEALLQKKEEILPLREVKARIKFLKSGLEELGLVNLGAIEEYERVNERFNFLSQQSLDLEEAKNSLYRVIEEMDEIMIKRFRDAYQEINTNFGEVFAELFSGGYAELVLTDGENILESGVDIIAQPPGKKLQHLSLLSGGEKALTAISLLFAFLKTKPSPFFILDEIEAALDEANVSRFATYLRQYSSRSQFVAISHRKGTMEAADVLYGVTMDSASVSKIVSMKMAAGEEEKVS